MSVSYIKEVKDWIQENDSSISNIKYLLQSQIDINKIFEKDNLDVKKNYP